MTVNKKFKMRLSYIVLVLVVLTSVSACFASLVSTTAEPQKTELVAANAFEGGQGTAADPYVIKTSEQFLYFANTVNSGTTYNTKFIELASDIDLSNCTNFVPIGYAASFNTAPSTGFRGSFDGKGFCISNCTITVTAENYKGGSSKMYVIGLFGATQNATINDLHVKNMNITIPTAFALRTDADCAVGGIVGKLIDSTITDCTVEGSTITANCSNAQLAGKMFCFGGIVGDSIHGTAAASLSPKIRNCSADVDIYTNAINATGTTAFHTNFEQYFVGGIVGRLRSHSNAPTNCVYEGAMTSVAYMGPIFGGIRVSAAQNSAARISTGDNVITSELSDCFYTLASGSSVANTAYNQRVDGNGDTDHFGIEITSIQTALTTLNTNAAANSYTRIWREHMSGGSLCMDYVQFAVVASSYDYSELTADLAIQLRGIYSSEAASGTSYSSVWSNGTTGSTLTVDLPVTIVASENGHSDNAVEYSATVTYAGTQYTTVNSFSPDPLIITAGISRNVNTLTASVSASSPLFDTSLYTYTWYDAANNVVGTGASLTLLGDETEDITVQAEYQNDAVGRFLCIHRYAISITAVYVDYSGTYGGADTNTGSIADPVKTLPRAYEILPSTGTTATNFVILMSDYMPIADSEDDKFATATTSRGDINAFYKPATITSSYDGASYNAKLRFVSQSDEYGKFLGADTKFEYLTFEGGDSYAYMYCRGNSLTMGNGIVMRNYVKRNGSTSNGVRSADNITEFHIIGGYLNYDSSVTTNTQNGVCNITIQSGTYARVIGGCRTSHGNSYVDPDSHDIYGSVDDPLVVNITIRITDSSNRPTGNTCDIGLVCGGQTDGTIYTYATVNIEAGLIGRVLGGSISYAKTMVIGLRYPINDIFGALVVNISGGTIKELFGGSLGRGKSEARMISLESLISERTTEHDIEINISGGIIQSNVYACGAGGIAGIDGDFYVKENGSVEPVLHTGGNDVLVCMNISGGEIQGNVFGGGYGYSEYMNASQALSNTGALFGNVEMNITGGTITGHVFGGGRGSIEYGTDKANLAQVTGNIHVTIEGVNVYDTYVFGGGMGFDNTGYLNMAKVTGNITVDIINSTVNYTVFGGGMDAITDGNTTVNITGSTIYGEDSGLIDEHAAVVGGGMGTQVDDRLAEVMGSTLVTITDSTIDSEVFGGGLYALTGREGTSHNMTITDSLITSDVFAAGMGTLANAALGHVTGTACLTINETEGATTRITGNVYGGGSVSRIYGTSRIVMNGGTIAAEQNAATWFDSGCIYGGGLGATAIAHGTTAVEINGGTVEKHVFGGGYAGAVDGDSSVTITAGTISFHVFGGGNEGITDASTATMSGGSVGGNLYGGSNLELAQSSTVIMSGGTVLGSVVGASNNAINADTTHISGAMQATVTISGVSRIYGGVYGGCFQSGTVTGNTSITMNGSDEALTDEYGFSVHYPIVEFRVFGGGYGIDADVIGNTSVYINGGTVGLLDSSGVAHPCIIGILTDNGLTNTQSIKGGSVFGGGEAGSVSGSTYVNQSSGAVAGSVYGGGYGATASSNSTTVIVSGGSIGSSVEVNAEINPDFSYTIVPTPTATSEVIDLLTGGNVFGGGENGPVMTNTNVVISGGIICCSVYGSGLGAQAVVHGNTDVTITACIVGCGVFGGGYEAIVEGNATMTIDGDYNQASNVHSIKIGMLFHNDVPATVRVINTRGQLMIAGAVFGGGNESGVVGDISIFIGEALIKDVLYCGGLGETAPVGGNIELTVGTTFATTDNDWLGTIIKDVYGGGYSGSVGGDVTMTINTVRLGKIVAPSPENPHGVFGGCLFGGGTFGDVAGDVSITIENGSFFDTVFGGGDNADIGGDATIIIHGGFFGDTAHEANFEDETFDENPNDTSHGMLFGGGKNGSIIGDVSITIDVTDATGMIRPSWFTNAMFGGGFGNSAAVNGNVTMDLHGGNLLCVKDIYGGGFMGPVFGTVDIMVEDATIGNYTNESTRIVGGHVYGGGHNSTVYDNVTMQVTNCDVYGIVYGGGERGIVNADCTVTVDSCDVGIATCGGGFTGDVRGVASLTVNNSVIGGRNTLFGGANSVYAGLEAPISTLGIVCGGGYYSDVNETNVRIDNNSVVDYAVYGGGYDGNVLGATELNIASATINGVVFGGGHSGTVDTTSVVIEDSAEKPVRIRGNSLMIKSVFGGGEGREATVFSSTSLRINLINPASIIDYSVYGGGDLGMVGTGIIRVASNSTVILEKATTNVLIENGIIGGNVFGGGNGKDTSGAYNAYMGALFGTATVRITGGTIGIDVFGCGNQSRVYAEKNENASYVYIDSSAGNTVTLTAGVFGGGNRGDTISTSANTYTAFGDTYVLVKGQHVDFVQNDFGGVFGDGNLCLVDGHRTIDIVDFYSTTGTENKQFYSLQRADEATIRNSSVLLMGATDMVAEFDDTEYSINRINKLMLEDGSKVWLYNVVNALGELISDVETTTNYRGTNPERSTTMTPQFISDYRAAVELETTRENTESNLIAVANGKYLEVKNELGEFGAVSGLFTLQLLNAVQGEGGGFVYADKDSYGDFICITKYPTGEYMDIVDAEILVGSDPTICHYWYIDGDDYTYVIDLVGFSGSTGLVDKKDVNLPLTDTTNVLTIDLTSIVMSYLPNATIAYPIPAGYYRVHMYVDGVDYLLCNNQLYDSEGNVLTNNILPMLATDNNPSTVSFALELANNVEEYAQVGTVHLTLHTDAGLPTETEYVFDLNINVHDRLATGQLFHATGNFYNGVGYSSDVVMTTESSFTCEFVTSYSPSMYYGLELSLSMIAESDIVGGDTDIGRAVPAGTKIIMIDKTYPNNPKYYYYVCASATTEIPLADFIEMGYTTKQMGYTGYTTNTLIREDILFVFDCEDVTDTSFVGSAVMLRHTYPTGATNSDVLRYDVLSYYTDADGNYTDAEGVILADQTQPIANPQESIYSYAPYFQYERNLTDDGIDSYAVTATDTSIHSTDDIELDVMLAESHAVVDSYYAEQSYAVYLTATDENDAQVLFPTGTVFRCDGIIYIADVSRSFVVLPIRSPGNHTISIYSGLDGFTVSELNINTALYSAPEGIYYNNIDTTHTTQTTFTVSPQAVDYYLKVESTPRIVSQGDTVTCTLAINDPTEPVSVTLLKKNTGSLTYSVINMRNALIEESGLAADIMLDAQGRMQFTFANNAELGVYRFAFTYHDRTEYVNIILK